MRADKMPDLPMSDAGITGGDYGKPISTSALKRGYTTVGAGESMGADFADSNGDTYVGDQSTFGGVVGRPNGWER